MTTSNTTKSARAEALAARLEDVNHAAIAATEAVGDQTPAPTTPAQGWPANFAAWHIAESHASIMGLISLAANSQPIPPVTAEMLDAANAANLAEHGGCTTAEAQALLRQNGATTAATIRALSDAQLDRSTVVPFLGDAPMSVAQLIEGVLIGHAQSHLASIKPAG